MNEEMIVITDGEVVLLAEDDQGCYSILYGEWYWLESADFQGWVFSYVDDEDGESYDLYIDLEDEDEEETQE